MTHSLEMFTDSLQRSTTEFTKSL